MSTARYRKRGSDGAPPPNLPPIPTEGLELVVDLTERTRTRLRSVVTRLRVMQRGARRELRDVPHA